MKIYEADEPKNNVPTEAKDFYLIEQDICEHEYIVRKYNELKAKGLLDSFLGKPSPKLPERIGIANNFAQYSENREYRDKGIIQQAINQIIDYLKERE